MHPRESQSIQMLDGERDNKEYRLLRNPCLEVTVVISSHSLLSEPRLLALTEGNVRNVVFDLETIVFSKDDTLWKVKPKYLEECSS